MGVASASVTSRIVRERRVAEPRQQALHGLGAAARLLQHLAVIRLGRVEQQQRVPGRRRVDHHEAVLALAHRLGEGAEHGDLLGAGAAQILLQKRAALRVEPAARRRQHLLGVALGLELRVDARHAQARRALPQLARRLLDVRGGIGGRERHREAAARQLAGDARGHGRLADAALAHGHDDTAPACSQLVDELVELLGRDRAGARLRQLRVGRVPIRQPAQRVDAEQRGAEQRHVHPRQLGQARRQIGDRSRGRSACIAAAVLSPGSRASNTPFRISCTLETPSSASSARVRSASVIDGGSGRATSTRVVCAGSRSARFEAAYSAFCASSPESGPRHDVPPTLVSMKLVQAAGSSSRRSV